MAGTTANGGRVSWPVNDDYADLGDWLVLALALAIVLARAAQLGGG